eukprot:1597728-Rhodomonas_salina.2
MSRLAASVRTNGVQTQRHTVRPTKCAGVLASDLAEEMAFDTAITRRHPPGTNVARVSFQVLSPRRVTDLVAGTRYRSEPSQNKT